VELIQEGFEVILIDNLYNSEAEVAGRIGMITGVTPKLEIFDLCDSAGLIISEEK
jgi:UDP-glucose 4-epimerase